MGAALKCGGMSGRFHTNSQTTSGKQWQRTEYHGKSDWTLKLFVNAGVSELSELCCMNVVLVCAFVFYFFLNSTLFFEIVAF